MGKKIVEWKGSSELLEFQPRTALLQQMLSPKQSIEQRQVPPRKKKEDYFQSSESWEKKSSTPDSRNASEKHGKAPQLECTFERRRRGQRRNRVIYLAVLGVTSWHCDDQGLKRPSLGGTEGLPRGWGASPWCHPNSEAPSLAARTTMCKDFIKEDWHSTMQANGVSPPPDLLNAARTFA